MSEDALAIVQRFGAALRERDLAEVRRLLHRDCVVDAAGGLPYSGRYHGARGFLDLFAAMTEVLWLKPGPLCQQSLDEKTVVSRFRLEFTLRNSDRSIAMDLVEIYSVSDGQIIGLDVYYKDPSALAALLTGPHGCPEDPG